MIWNQSEKNDARQIVCTEERYYKTILILPSYSCLDLKALWENKNIDKNTYVFAIERFAPYAKKIRATLAKMGIQGQVIEKECDKINLEQELHGRKLDFIYLDTCSQLNKDNVRWLHGVAIAQERVFAKGFSLWFGFSNYTRTGKPFGDAVHAAFHRESTPEPLMMGTKEIKNEAQYDQNKAMFRLLCALFGQGNSYIYKNSEAKQTMHVFEFSGTKACNASLNRVYDFILEYDEGRRCNDENTGKENAMGNSAGAKKAWKTIKKNAAAKKQKNRARALKAWVTIRANERKATAGVKGHRIAAR